MSPIQLSDTPPSHLATFALFRPYRLPALRPPLPSLFKAQTARCKDCKEGKGAETAKEARGPAEAGATRGKEEQLAAVKRRALARVVAKRTRFH